MKRPLQYLLCCLVPGGMLAAAPPELPSHESLGVDSDYGVLLAADAAPQIRRQALRRIFESAKPIADDPADPFARDFSDFTPLGDVVTADMRHAAMRDTGEVLADGSSLQHTALGPSREDD
jgi:hypothetical protein